MLGADRAELGVVGQSRGVVRNVVAGTEAGAWGQLGWQELAFRQFAF